MNSVPLCNTQNLHEFKIVKLIYYAIVCAFKHREL
jgi:hypothetical protein